MTTFQQCSALEKKRFIKNFDSLVWLRMFQILFIYLRFFMRVFPLKIPIIKLTNMEFFG